ncbi:MAG: helix-turn-helix transcriptional regulator [Desulfomonile tiedjei]|nr:helix-turn-helix transcriptional regulator [Desulfomonile tiedjei]
MMDPISIPVLVRRLRTRLGLTQEQFAHKVGVTFSTVNQWENDRRRPQPFLLKRLLEMESALGKGPAGRLTREEARAFKKRWEAVNAAESQELAATEVAHKFRQLAALLTSAEKLGWTETRAGEESQGRDQWARLRRGNHV